VQWRQFSFPENSQIDFCSISFDFDLSQQRIEGKSS
jgi:hypothetical protein